MEKQNYPATKSTCRHFHCGIVAVTLFPSRVCNKKLFTALIRIKYYIASQHLLITVVIIQQKALTYLLIYPGGDFYCFLAWQCIIRVLQYLQDWIWKYYNSSMLRYSVTQLSFAFVGFFFSILLCWYFLIAAKAYIFLDRSLQGNLKGSPVSWQCILMENVNMRPEMSASLW